MAAGRASRRRPAARALPPGVGGGDAPCSLSVVCSSAVHGAIVTVRSSLWRQLAGLPSDQRKRIAVPMCVRLVFGFVHLGFIEGLFDVPPVVRIGSLGAGSSGR